MNETNKFFYNVTFQLVEESGKTATSMQGIIMDEEITYAGIQEAADVAYPRHSALVVLYEKKMTMEEYRNYWGLKAPEEAPEEK